MPLASISTVEQNYFTLRGLRRHARSVFGLYFNARCSWRRRLVPVNLSQILVTMSFLKLKMTDKFSSKSKQKSGHIGSVVLVSEWWVNTPCLTELGDIARWRGINRHLKTLFFVPVYKTHPPTFNFFGGKKVRLIHRDLWYTNILLLLLLFKPFTSAQRISSKASTAMKEPGIERLTKGIEISLILRVLLVFALAAVVAILGEGYQLVHNSPSEVV